MGNETELLLRTSRLKTLTMFLIFTTLTGIGIWLVVKEGALIAWLTTAFFGLGMIFSIVQALPNASYLLLTAHGLKCRSLFRTFFIKWDEVGSFSLSALYYKGIASHRMVVFNFTEEYKIGRITQRVAKALTGAEGALPDTYGMKAEELALLLNEWKHRFLQSSQKGENHHVPSIPS